MPEVSLTITLTEQGQLRLSGPINNHMLCVFMCEAAKDYLFDLAKNPSIAKQESSIVAASAADLPPAHVGAGKR